MQSTLTHNIDDILLLFEHCGALFSTVMKFWNRAPPGAYCSWKKKRTQTHGTTHILWERWYETLICCSKAHSNTMLILLSNHLSTGGLLLGEQRMLKMGRLIQRPSCTFFTCLLKLWIWI